MFESHWTNSAAQVARNIVATLSSAKGLKSLLVTLPSLGRHLRFFAPLRIAKVLGDSRKSGKRQALILVSLLTIGLLACGQSAAQINNSGHESYKNEDYPAALDAYSEAQEKTEEIGEPYYNAGNVLYRTEQYQDSLQQYDEALKFAEEELRAAGFFNRGNVHFQSERYGEAVEAYKEVLRMNPDNRDAKHNLELALVQLPPQQGGEEPQENEEQGPGDQQQQQSQDQRQDNQQQEQQRDEQQDQNQENEQQNQQEQPRPQTEPVTEEQARQILQTIGEDAQTLQERLQQILVSPNPPPAQDW